MVAVASNNHSALLEALGFGSTQDMPFGGGTLRAQVRESTEDGRTVFKQSADDWSGGSEWAKAMRSKAIAAGAVLKLQERARDGKSFYEGVWNGTQYELEMYKSYGCKENAYFATLRM